MLRIYTTRPDTLYGATYMVIAPEHPFVERLTKPECAPAVRAYRETAARKSDLDRTDLAKEKTGVFTGSYAINPVNGEPIPIWVADYVLASYGTGAIMAVPAHDTRDFEFAKQFDLPIVAVVSPLPLGEGQGVRAAGTEDADLAQSRKDAGQEGRAQLSEARYFAEKTLAEVKQKLADIGLQVEKPPTSAESDRPHPNPLPEGEGTKHDSPLLQAGEGLGVRAAFIADGIAVNSGTYNGLTTAEFKQRITEELAACGLGRSAVNYKLRDWLFSRQHFWGEPFPILHELDGDGKATGRLRALAPEELPLDLPAEMQFDAKHDEPTPPLDKAPADWLYVTRDGKRYKRETNTMPQWAGSCWYFLRFLDPNNDQALVDPEIERAWMPVDLYVGGAEHAVLHLLYARFWHKVLFDRGHVSTPEPFQKLVNQGMILGENGEKMSKSRGNVVNPDEVVREYGADSLRLYEMFMGPLEAVKPWSMDGVSGVRGFLDRVWRMMIDDRSEAVQLNTAVQEAPPTAAQNRVLHKTVKAVTADLEQMSFNTAIARMMEFTNFFLKEDRRPRAAMETFVLLLSPLAPHIAEELWQALGHGKTLAYEPWPGYNEAALKEDSIEVPVQVNGKLRGKVVVPAGADAAALEAAARDDAKVAEWLSGKRVAKVIVVPGRMVNFVVR